MYKRIVMAIGLVLLALFAVWLLMAKPYPMTAVTPLGGGDLEGPREMRLTVPEMRRVADLPVYTASPSGWDEAMHKSAVHVRGTGLPWNTHGDPYISGHKLGFPGTRSWKVFDDLYKLGKGDKILVSDSQGTEYEYRVTKVFVVGPSDDWVLDRKPGVKMLTLQTCTDFPYLNRVIVRAEMV